MEPLGIRSAGAARLDVVAIGLKSQEAGSDLSTLVPGGAEGGRTGRGTGGDRSVRPGADGAVLILWSLPPFWTGVLIAVAVAPAAFSVWMAQNAYAALGHRLDARYLVSRHGSIRRGTVHLQRSGIIGWRLRQSLFQRRLGLMTVDATTAAGRGHYATLDAGEHEALDFAADAVPGRLEPFLIRRSAVVPAEPSTGRGEAEQGPAGQYRDR